MCFVHACSQKSESLNSGVHSEKHSFRRFEIDFISLAALRGNFQLKSTLKDSEESLSWRHILPWKQCMVSYQLLLLTAPKLLCLLPKVHNNVSPESTSTITWILSRNHKFEYYHRLQTVSFGLFTEWHDPSLTVYLHQTKIWSAAKMEIRERLKIKTSQLIAKM